MINDALLKNQEKVNQFQLSLESRCKSTKNSVSMQKFLSSQLIMVHKINYELTNKMSMIKRLFISTENIFNKVKGSSGDGVKSHKDVDAIYSKFKNQVLNIRKGIDEIEIKYISQKENFDNESVDLKPKIIQAKRKNAIPLSKKQRK